MTATGATIAALAPRLAAGEITARALLDQCLAAMAARDHEIHAMLAIAPGACAAAEAADRARESGVILGPLHGIPLVIKDNIDVAGLPTTSGCIGLKRAVARRDAQMVARLRAAGAIILGKTNLSEFSFEIRSRSSLGGDVRHPLKPMVTPGGSSGGTAAAIACGYALAGLGTDTGGSIRVPAAYCGLVGFRPAHGVLSLDGVAPLAPATDTIGPIGRSVADVALLLRVMGLLGARGGSMAAAPNRALRVGVLRQAYGPDERIAAALGHAEQALRAAGVTLVDPVTLPEAVLPTGGDHIVDAQFADAFDAYLAARFPAAAPGGLAGLLERGEILPDYRDILAARLARKGGDDSAILASHARLAAAMTALMREERLDALLFPTSQVVPTSLDNPKGGWAPELAARSGWPAISVPSGGTVDGLPVGAELLAPRDAELTLLHLAERIEAGA